jgi:hypothetical protein
MKINLKTLKDGGEIIFNFVIKNSPTILTTIGVIAMAAGTAKAIVEAPKAKEELEDVESDPDLSHKDYIKAKARVILYHYWSTAALTAGGAGIIFWGHKISLARTAAALAAYQMTKDDLKTLEDKIVETDGEKKLNKMKNSILKDEVGTGPNDISTVYNTGHGNTLFYDPIGRRFFLSDIEFIRKQASIFNMELAKQIKLSKKAVMSLNDWYDFIDLEPLDGTIDGNTVCTNIGKDMGWRNKLLDLKFTSILMSNNEHCTVMGYSRNGGPEWDMNISDDYYTDDLEDDSTDMKWR